MPRRIQRCAPRDAASRDEATGRLPSFAVSRPLALYLVQCMTASTVLPELRRVEDPLGKELFARARHADLSQRPHADSRPHSAAPAHLQEGCPGLVSGQKGIAADIKSQARASGSQLATRRALALAVRFSGRGYSLSRFSRNGGMGAASTLSVAVSVLSRRVRWAKLRMGVWSVGTTAVHGSNVRWGWSRGLPAINSTAAVYSRGRVEFMVTLRAYEVLGGPRRGWF